MFCQPWYLDAFCGKGNWQYITYKKDEEHLAVMPCFQKKKYGINYITMPEVTLFMGPIFKDIEHKSYYKRLSFEKEAISNLIDQLPKSFKINYSLHHLNENFLPFQWKGFSISPRVTYHIKTNECSLEEIKNKYNSSIKRQINKAKKNLKVIQNQDIDSFIQVNAMSYERQGSKIPYTIEKLKKMHLSAKANNCILQFAIDDDENIHATNFLLWDEKFLYYYLSGMNPEHKESGAQSLLIDRAIELAHSKGLEFNFYGSRIEGIERFFRSFGSEQLISYMISK